MYFIWPDLLKSGDGESKEFVMPVWKTAKAVLEPENHFRTTKIP